MGLLNWFSKSKRALHIDYDKGVPINIGEARSTSGFVISESTAVTVSTVWRASLTLAQSMPPMKIYQRKDEGRTEARDHQLWDILHDEPNLDQSAYEFFALLQFRAIIWGNGYAEIVRNGAGEVVELVPIPPWAVTFHDQQYQIQTDSGPVTLSPADMLHIKGPSLDGSVGARLVDVARTSLDVTLACERFAASYFGNSCKLGGVLKTAGVLSDQARENLRKSWNGQYSGADRAGTVGLLEEGLDFAPFSINNNEGQFLESRQHQVLEVCRWIGVDPIFVYAFGANPGGVAEQQTRNFLTFSLNPWLRKWEGEINRKCGLKGTPYYAEFVREALLSLDAKTQSDLWSVGVDKGWYTIDNVRDFLNLEPLTKNEPKPEEGSSVAVPLTPEAAPVQDTAMNGAQIASLLLITDKVALKMYPPEAAIAIIKQAFPSMDGSSVSEFVNALAKAPAPQAPEQGPTPPQENNGKKINPDEV